jgi:hypothetical protein
LRDVNEKKSNDTIWGKKVKNRKIENGWRKWTGEGQKA